MILDRNPLRATPSDSAHFDFDTYVLLREFIRERTGIIYSAHRRAVFENRISTRIQALNLPDAAAYYRYLTFHAARDDEFLQLASVLTNNETYFFREATSLEAALGWVREHRTDGEPMRILSAGSSSGEELCTFAMLGRERGVDTSEFELQGVDLDVRMLETAQAGIYRNKSFRNTSAERIVRHFLPEGEGRRVRPAIHRYLSFRWANLVDASTLRFPHKFDVIFCRNVLIYFDQDTTEQVAATLHGMLKDDGILVTGVSESLSAIPFLFDPERVDGVVLYRKLPL